MVVAAMAVVIAIAVAIVSAAHLQVVAARVDAAADAAALAAADTALGFADGEPCARAEMVASANHAILASCVVDGMNVTVECVDAGGLPVRGIALAGPPPASDPG